jgi:hypothetical protein
MEEFTKIPSLLGIRPEDEAPFFCNSLKIRVHLCLSVVSNAFNPGFQALK